MIDNTVCHNCKRFKKMQKLNGVWVKINNVTVWFHTRTCFKSWNKKYDGKYEGGIIEDQK